MGRVVNTADYTFNKAAKTITFSSRYTGIELAQIQLITDVTNSTVIYQFNKAGYGGTLVGLVLTLAYDTTGAGFNNTDNLMIIVNETQDNTVLYSGKLTNTGSISGIDTTDQQTLSIQVSGSWEGIVMVEGSNDNSYYIPLMVHPVNEFTLLDNINEDGIFNLATSTKYVRLNVVQLQTGSIDTLILGRIVDGPNAADRLSLAMDRTQNMPLNIQDVNGSPGILKKDAENALILSDGKTVASANRIFTSGEVMAVIDTQGYQMMSWHMITGGSTLLTLQGSNDGVNWSTNILTAYSSQSGNAPTSTLYPVSNSLTAVLCSTRYIRVICTQTTTYTFVVSLRNSQVPLMAPGGATGIPVSVNNTAASNITQINFSGINQPGYSSAGGATIAFGGFAGGGLAAHGSTGVVVHPTIIGGRQAPTAAALAGTVRTMLHDFDGRVQVGLNILDQTRATNAQLTGSQLQVITSNVQNGNSLAVTDLQQFEGQNHTELLGQILLEMRIMNQYLYELPQKLNAGLNNLDEPTQFRNEQSVFTL